MVQISVSVDKIQRSQCFGKAGNWDRFSVEDSAPFERSAAGIAVYNLSAEKSDARALLECHADGMVFRLTTRDARNLAEALLLAADACDERTRADVRELGDYFGEPMAAPQEA